MNTTKIFKDYASFLQREDKKINGISQAFINNDYDNWEEDNQYNEGCWDCSGCSGCSDLKNAAPVVTESVFNVPIIENIHQKILEAVSVPKAFDMSTWHTCETTHCRAGWVVHLAGEAGKALEDKNLLYLPLCRFITNQAQYR